jgi:chromate transporter
VTRPSYPEFLRYWLKHGCINFGGPAGQIALMQHDLVDGRKWVDQTAFLRGLNFATLLPGPEAQQLATYVGWRLFGIRGALTAGLLFFLPGALVLYVLAWVAAQHGDLAPVRAVFEGLQPIVIAVIGFAVFRLAKRAFKGWPPVAMAAAAFVALQFLRVPFPIVVFGAGLIGWLCSRLPNNPFPPAGHGKVDDDATELPPSGGWTRAIGLAALYIVLLLIPVGLAVAAFGRGLFLDIAVFFTKAAYVTFGGAYAVLPYVAEQAVRAFGWLSPDEMLNGMALAETTPGPLIMVLQYVGFFAGWNHAPSVGLSPLTAATIGAALSTYVTFLPSTFFILIGAPYIERIGRIAWAGSALSAITAAVVGVILTLAVFLGAQVIFPGGQLDWIALVAMLATLGVMIAWNLEIHWLVLAGATLGLARMQFAV